MDLNGDQLCGECPVCMELMLLPKSLFCGHSICAKCEVQLRVDNKIGCPACRKFTHVPLSGLPTNFGLKHMIENELARKLKDAAMSAKQKACTACDKRMSFEDCWRCKTCSHMILCAQCSCKGHRDHTLMDLPSIIQHNKQLAENWYTHILNECEVAVNGDQAQFSDLKNEFSEVTKVVHDLCTGAQTELDAHHTQILQRLKDFKKCLLSEVAHESIMIEANDLDDKLEQDIRQYRGRNETITNKIGNLKEIVTILKHNVSQLQSFYGGASNQSGRQWIDFIGLASAGGDSNRLQVFVKYNELEFGFQVDSNSTVLSLLNQFYTKAGISNKLPGYGLFNDGVLLEDNKLIRDYPMVTDRVILQFHTLAISKHSKIKREKIVVIGGRNGKVKLDTIFAYDPEIGCNSMIMKLNGPIIRHSSGLHNGSEIIVAGGHDENKCLKSVKCIHTSTKEIESLPDMALERIDSASGLIGNKFIVIGGFNGDIVLESCECLDLCTKTWSNIAPLPTPLDGSSAIQFREDNQDTILLIGGQRNNGTFSDKVYQYYLASDTWRERPEWKLPEPIDSSGLVMWRGRLVICGGRSSGDTLPNCYALDLERGVWEEIASLNVARCIHQTVVYGGDIIVIGGLDDNENILQSVELYNGYEWVFKNDLDTRVMGFSAIVL